MTTINAGNIVTASEINQWAPPGIVADYAGAAAPTGWLLCDGASYLRTDYPDLFTAIGTTYGAADGTHFNVPDCRGRVPVGYAASGGHTDVSTLGANDGVAAANRRAKHRHTPHTHSAPTASVRNANLSTTVGSNAIVLDSNVDATNFSLPGAAVPSKDGGSGVAADSLDAPAYIVLNKIIRAKDV